MKLFAFAKQTFPLAVLIGSLTTTSGQDSIVYHTGPSFSFGFDAWGMLDMNDDGETDFDFETGFVLLYSMSTPCKIFPSETSQVLAHNYQATILRFGAPIANAMSTNTAWSSRSAVIAAYYSGLFSDFVGWGGALSNPGIGYLGVRFSATDGLHYGWIRVRLPMNGETLPVVVDWAYESRPDTAICAGVIGSKGPSRQFIVDFGGRNSEPLAATGTFILTGNTLRGELTFTNSFSTADLTGPAAIRAKTKPFATLDKVGVTSFFGDVTLRHPEIIQLLHGRNHVSVDDGIIVGEIVPLR